MATTTNSTTSAPKAGPTKAELEAKIAELEALLAAAKEQQKPEAEEAPRQAQPQYVPPVQYITPYNTDVTIVYCSDSIGYAKISNMELNFNKYGEEYILTRSQFDELVGKYRSWFDRGVLAVSFRNVDAAAAKGVKTDREYGLTVADLEKLGSMTLDELKELWERNQITSHKECIVSYYRRKFIENEVGYRDRAKVDLLNTLTDGCFSREQDELSGRIKVSQIDL